MFGDETIPSNQEELALEELALAGEDPDAFIRAHGYERFQRVMGALMGGLQDAAPLPQAAAPPMPMAPAAPAAAAAPLPIPPR